MPPSEAPGCAVSEDASASWRVRQASAALRSMQNRPYAPHAQAKAAEACRTPKASPRRGASAGAVCECARCRRTCYKILEIQVGKLSSMDSIHLLGSGSSSARWLSARVMKDLSLYSRFMSPRLARREAIGDLSWRETRQAKGCRCHRSDADRGCPCASALPASGRIEVRSLYERRDDPLRGLGSHQSWGVSTPGDEYRRPRHAVLLLIREEPDSHTRLLVAATKRHAVCGLAAAKGRFRGSHAPAADFTSLLAGRSRP